MHGNTTDIGTQSAGGYANAAAQDSFCAGTDNFYVDDVLIQ